MANPILQQLMQNQSPAMPIMMQAVGAMIRGESPQQFMQRLAQTNPQLQGLDLSGDLEQTAQSLYTKNGEDYNAAKSNIRSQVNQFIANKTS